MGLLFPWKVLLRNPHICRGEKEGMFKDSVLVLELVCIDGHCGNTVRGPWGKGVPSQISEIVPRGSVHFPRAERNSKGEFSILLQECKKFVLLTRKRGEVNHLKKVLHNLAKTMATTKPRKSV